MTSTATTSDPFVKRLHTIDRLISSGKLSEAAQRLNAASKSSPRDPRVYLLGSRLAEAAGNPEGARDAARKAVGFAPDWSVAVTELAFLLARQNQLREAVSYAEKAMQMDGDNPQVLARAIDVAHRAQHFDLATNWLQRAARIAPDDPTVKRLLARNMRFKGQHEAAIAAYTELIQASATDWEALLGRLQSALAIGNRAMAMQDGDALLSLSPGDEEYIFWSQLARGATPTRQPVAMVRALYDGFADLYDQHVVASLKYKLPREVGHLITERYPDLKLNVLDLGCGTGLLGASLGRIQGAMIGVDISPRMVEQAIRHNVYDRFHTVDLLEALEATPANLYNVVTALDVFGYIGDLTQAIPDAFRILQDGGQFIFSCETAPEDGSDFVLLPTQRYAHKASHIEATCRASGFDQVTLEPIVLHYENNEPLRGFLVVASKSTPRQG
jgi:predicted TPR repeat methyltransferase